MKQAAESMVQKTYTKKSSNKSVVWWDTNLKNLNKCRNRLLNEFRRNKREDSLSKYLKCKTNFRVQAKNKKQKYFDDIYNNLIESVNSKNEILLWKNVRLLKPKPCFTSNTTPKQWFEYFSTVLNVEVKIDTEQKRRVSHHTFLNITNLVLNVTWIAQKS